MCIRDRTSNFSAGSARIFLHFFRNANRFLQSDRPPRTDNNNMPQLTHVQRAVALTLLETSMQLEVAKRFNVDVSTIKRLKTRAKNMAPGELAPRRKPSGGLNNKKLGVLKLRRLKNIV